MLNKRIDKIRQTGEKEEYIIHVEYPIHIEQIWDVSFILFTN